jgi:hypothetical protein
MADENLPGVPIGCGSLVLLSHDGPEPSTRQQHLTTEGKLKWHNHQRHWRP